MAFITQVESLRMNRYIPLTGLDSNVPALLIDAQAPIHVLHAAVYRIRTVTEALESLACHEGMSSREGCTPCASSYDTIPPTSLITCPVFLERFNAFRELSEDILRTQGLY